MRFDRHSRTNPYVNRRDQYRLLRLVGLAALVMVLVQVAAQPASWNWFFALSDSKPAPSSTADYGGPLTPLDIKRPDATAPLPEDAFYARVEETKSSPPDLPPTVATDMSGQLPADVFTGVEDDWFGPTRAEQPALLRVARHIDGLSPESLQSIASREATFDSLTGRPEYFRGRPVALSGRLRRFTPGRIGADDDSRGIWEAWIVADDSHNTPYLVYCLEAPAGMPQGEQVDEAVQFAGYVIRRFAYASRGGESVTTLLMSPTLRWTPATTPVPERLTTEMQWSTLIGIVMVTAVMLLVGGWYFLSDRKYRRSHVHAIGESRLDVAAEDLQKLAQLDAGDPHQIRVPEPAEQPATR